MSELVLPEWLSLEMCLTIVDALYSYECYGNGACWGEDDVDEIVGYLDLFSGFVERLGG